MRCGPAACTHESTCFRGGRERRPQPCIACTRWTADYITGERPFGGIADPRGELSPQYHRMLLARLAHDLRHSLTVVRRRTQLLLRSVEHPESMDLQQVCRDLARIESTARLMATFLDRVVESSTRRAEPVALVCPQRYLVRTVRDCVNRYQQTLPTEIRSSSLRRLANSSGAGTRLSWNVSCAPFCQT
jgi:signal transduction histidine kinase